MPLSPGQRRLYSGDYNYLNEEWQPDGTVIVTVSGGKLPFGHRLHVRDLWGPDEEVLDEKVIPPGPPPHIAARLAEAAAAADVGALPSGRPEEAPHDSP